ncbi:MAG: SpoIID/LytB domain-containing protein, partial [Muribaculaceae bacterium]|nr:SpoIID/LytB domain-containing protein [Muribaculaceae bacterium]
MNQPVVKVGIMSTEQLHFVLLGTFHVNGAKVEGDQTATVKDGKIYWNGDLYDRLSFIPDDNSDNSRFTLKDVTIGVNFHWERLEDQTFVGQLDLIVENNKITPINVLGVEDYLKSVISSEMSATASLELLKAHAVISRSWLLSQIEKNKEITNSGQKYSACTVTDDEIVKWYDREDHINFDVCADDHCQRYQGVTRQTTPNVDQAVEATRGEVLWG